MSVTQYLYAKILDYLSGLETEYIMAATVIYQGLEEVSSIKKNDLKSIVERAVGSIISVTSDEKRIEKFGQILPQVSNEFFAKLH